MAFKHKPPWRIFPVGSVFCFCIFVGRLSVHCLFFALNNLKSCDWKKYCVSSILCIQQCSLCTDNFDCKILENWCFPCVQCHFRQSCQQIIARSGKLSRYQKETSQPWVSSLVIEMQHSKWFGDTYNYTNTLNTI